MPASDALWSAAGFVALRVFRAADFRLCVFFDFKSFFNFKPFLDLELFFPERRFIAYPA
jgi:hypothetical protein